MTTVSLNPSPATFPATEMIDAGLWAALSLRARCVLPVLWDFHRQYPDACHPSRATLAKKAGVSGVTVTRAIQELEAVGLVHVLPAPGVGANTYRLQWRDLTVPEKRERNSATGASPFAWPKPESDLTLTTDGRGQDKVVRERKVYSHKMPDGCVVRSAHEVRLHSYLIEWKVPHWSGVPYKNLGIRGLHPESTVDFVVAPRLLVEHFGLPRIQGQAIKYNKKRREKEAAIAKAGWTLITVEAGLNFEFAQVKLIYDRWAASTIEDAEKLETQIEAAGMWHPWLRSRERLEAHILCAELRRDGQRVPRELVYPVAPSVNGYEASPQKPFLVLGVRYNETAKQAKQAHTVATPPASSGSRVPVGSKPVRNDTGPVGLAYSGEPGGVVGLTNDGGVHVEPSAVRPISSPRIIKNSDDFSMKDDMRCPTSVWHDFDDPEEDEADDYE